MRRIRIHTRLFLPLSLGGLTTLALLTLLWRLSGPPVARAADLTVCPAGPPTCGFSTIQGAVDAANYGDVIKVATGTYSDVHSRPAPPGYPSPPASNAITQVVYISESITLRGGYTTANWTTPDPVANPTTLDAGGLGRVMVIADPSSQVPGQTFAPTVEGLRLTGGDAQELGGGLSGLDAGGGVYVYGGLLPLDSNATLVGNTVWGNTASTAADGFGGGLYLYLSDATLQSNTVVSNTASTASGGSGGGLSLYLSDATVEDNTVVSNTASTATGGTGGGLSLFLSDATLVGNTVVSNTATLSPTATGWGGGLYLYDSDGKLQGNTVQGNIASTAGLGLGGGLYLHLSAATLEGNTVVSNTASTTSNGAGGGLFLQEGDATLQGNTVQGNIASTKDDGSGGGFYLYSCAAMLEGNTVVSNTATLSPTANGWGGGLWVGRSGPLTLTNNLVVDNHANTEGSGLWFVSYFPDPPSGHLLHTTIANNHGSGEGVYVSGDTTLAFTNTIIAGHGSVGITVTTGSSVTLDATLWYGNGSHTGGGGTIHTSHDQVGDPAFMNPPRWDYHLRGTSAAIDAGVDAGVTTDIDDQARPLGDGFDIGADEFQPHPGLALTKRASQDPVEAGERLTYTIRITNTGNLPLTATITDVLPDHCTPSAILNWTPTLTVPDGVWTHPVVVTVEQGYAGLLTNVVQVTTEEGATGVYTETTLSLAPHLQVVKRAIADTVHAGERLTYTINVTNTGNVTLTATITDLLPDHCTPGGRLTWTPTIPATHVWTKQVVVTAEQRYSGTLVNVVQVTTLEGATGVYTETCRAITVEYFVYLPVMLSEFP